MLRESNEDMNNENEYKYLSSKFTELFLNEMARYIANFDLTHYEAFSLIQASALESLKKARGEVFRN